MTVTTGSAIRLATWPSTRQILLRLRRRSQSQLPKGRQWRASSEFWRKWDFKRWQCTRCLPTCSVRSWSPFLRAFAKLRKVTVSFVMSVCPSVRMEELDPNWTVYEILYLSFFRKYVQKIQVSLKSDKNNGYFRLRRFYIYDNISLNYS